MFFFFNDTATTEIYTLSLHDALPILVHNVYGFTYAFVGGVLLGLIYVKSGIESAIDRKSTRLNSSHGYISYAVFCLKKKTKFRVVHNHEATICHTLTDSLSILMARRR